MNTGRRSSLLLVTAWLGAGLVAGRLLPVVIDRAGGTAPRPGWATAVTLLLAALIVAALAWRMFQAVHRKKRTVHAEFAVLVLAIAKSCVIVGAAFCGAYGGFALAYTDVFDTEFGRERVIHGGAAAVAALLLLAAALVLERACELPGDGDDKDLPGGKSLAAGA